LAGSPVDSCICAAQERLLTNVILWLFLWLLLWARTCGDQRRLRRGWNPADGRSFPATSEQENQIMTAEAPSVTAQPDAARPLATVARPFRQDRRSEHSSRISREPAGADLRRDDPLVTDLVTRARNGDQQAWDALVERYAPLTWSICRRYRLADADAKDVGQTVWLQLVDHLDTIRDPAALPGWLATVTRRECLRVLGAARGQLAAERGLGAEIRPDEQAETVEQELLAAERHAALREGFTQLPSRCQRLMVLLIEDPPVPYAEISARLGIPVGSIGPNRSRCLDKLRRHPAIAGLARQS
jgi:RNA polymerase sigma factor (sigma-70 family)